MIDIEEMTPDEMHALLQQAGYGHLGLVRDSRPYVVPIHYAYQQPDIYLYTTEGQKTDYMAANPEVCLQVEQVRDPAHWQSVIIIGRAERLRDADETKRVTEFIKQRNPTLTPAVNRTWLDVWGRENITAIYRIHPSRMSGRKTQSPD